MIYASVKGFGPGPYEDCKVYENVAQCTGGAASTTGELDGMPLVTGAQIGDSGTGLHLALGIVTALYQRNQSGRGQRVTCAMQDGVLNLCRVKLRDQQRLTHGPLTEYPQYPNGEFGEAAPRAGNAFRWRPAGLDREVQGMGDRPRRLYLRDRPSGRFRRLAKVIGHEGWLEDPEWNTPKARLQTRSDVLGDREMDHDQDQVRSHGHSQSIERAVWTDPQHERAG